MWFRYYIEALDDPKVQQLSAEHFRTWVNLLCIAAKHGGKLPSKSDCAFALRVTPDTFRVTFAALHDAKLFDKDVGRDKHTEPHNWSKRQYKSDTSAERTRRYRKRHSDVTVTPPDTETETDTEEERKLPSAAKETAASAAVLPPLPACLNRTREVSNAKRGTRLEPTWQPDEQDRGFAINLGLDSGHTAEQFRDHWHAKPGQAGVALDWKAKWRTWCRNEAKWTAERVASRPRSGGIVAGTLEDIAAIESEI
mgnify:CR=1 FL=1